MKPITKTEKEVVKLGHLLHPLSERQKRWMKERSSPTNTKRYYSRKADIQQFLIVTVCRGWQVIRHFYMYAYYRYGKIAEVTYLEVMQEWLKDGKYVFLSLNRFGLGYMNDAWSYGELEVRRGVLGGVYLQDPRDLAYSDVLFIKVQDKYKYLPQSHIKKGIISEMYRGVNVHPYNETLLKNNYDIWKWSLRYGFLFDREKTAAIKIAMRYKYKIDTLWKDMIDSLAYLHKDLHNPLLVCPADLKNAHDKWCNAAGNRRKRMREKMDWVRSFVGNGPRCIKAAAEKNPYYTRMRKRFFGLVIAEDELEIKVLQSVQEFAEEGRAMHHCVFNNAYYDVKRRPNCLILSARKDGERVETIEVNLADYSVVQAHGVHNSYTPYHNKILDIMNRNMDSIRLLNTKKGHRQTAAAS